MADDSILVDAPMSSVFAVLADPRRYEQFVVGNSGIRHFDPDWPEDGSEFAHTLGVKPMVIHDTSTCLATDNHSFLVLLTRMGWLGATITTFVLHADPGGTELEIREEPLWGLVSRVWSKVTDMVLDWRNRRLLARFTRLAEEQFARERSVLPAGGQSPAEQTSG